MGIEFRGSRYKRDISFGKRTVKDGEAVAVWNRLGVHRQVVGPALVRLFFSTIAFLDKKVAEKNEYLVVVMTDGNIDHIRGPVTMYENPVYHRSITVQQAYPLVSSTECIVVNREIHDHVVDKVGMQLQSNRIERVIIRGPNLYFPLVGDSIVNFIWHGSNPLSGDLSISAGVQKFTVLTTSARQWKVDIPFMMSQKGSNLPGLLQLTFCFNISDVNLMLDNTSDVIGDLYDALVVDLADIQNSPLSVSGEEEGRVRRDEEVSGGVIRLFSSINSLPHMTGRARVIGVTLESVSYRGFELSNDAKRARQEYAEMENRLARDRMMAQQEQTRIEADLMARQARLEQEKNLSQAQLAARRETLQAEQEYKEAELRYTLGQDAARLQANGARALEVNNETLRVLGELNKLGVDLTALLCGTGVAGRGEGEEAGTRKVSVGTPLNDIFSLGSLPDLNSPPPGFVKGEASLNKK
jgi:hypothetical protein